MWKFLKRQLKTKTGKGAIVLITGSLVNAIVGPEIAAKATPIVSETIVGLANGVFDPISIGIGLMGMYLRDSKAKEEHGE